MLAPLLLLLLLLPLLLLHPTRPASHHQPARSCSSPTMAAKRWPCCCCRSCAPQDWHPITSLLKRLIAGHGFGKQGLHAGKAVAEKKAGALHPGEREGKGPFPSPVLQVRG